jgi:hypothetical protein
MHGLAMLLHWFCCPRALELVEMQCVFLTHNGDSWQGLQVKNRYFHNAPRVGALHASHARE